MSRIWILASAAAALLASGCAEAQSWGYPDRSAGVWGGYNGGYRGGWGRGWGRDGYDGRAREVCSGQRGSQLQNQLRHEWNEGEIDPRTAQRIDRELDKLDDKAREECGERDWGAIRGISDRYDRVAQWIDREAHSGWNQRGRW